MKEKRRAPLEQLLEAGKVAKQLLQKKGLVASEGVLDDLVKFEGAPVLPGLPTYLPHQWTIKAAQRMMYDLLLMWKEACKGKERKAENITEFFKFVVKQLRAQEKEYDKELRFMPKLLKSLKEVPVLKEVFSPMRKKENVKAIQRFFIDSFAVAIVVKHNDTTSEYANWFIDWSEALYQLWIKPQIKDKIKDI